MRITKKQIAHAIDLDGDESPADIAIALRNLETILDAVASSIDDDRESDALGDASNLIQVIREGLTA